MTQEQKTKISEHFDWLHTTATASNFPDGLKDVLKAAYLAGAAYALDIYCHRWISVDDELPPHNQAYLAYWLHLGVGRYRFVKANEKVGKRFKEHITHWMPLPSIEGIKGNQGKTSPNVEGGEE